MDLDHKPQPAAAAPTAAAAAGAGAGAAAAAAATAPARSKPAAGAKLLFGKHGRPIVIQPDTNPPSRTLYVRNLPEKMGHTTLRRHLMRQFENFGELVQVRCSRAILKRGQAWIVFKRLDDARVAYKEMQDQQFLGKPMIVQYAKMMSRSVATELGMLEEYAEKHANRAEERVKELADRQSKRASLAAARPPMQPLAMPMGMPPPPPPPMAAMGAPGALPPGFVPPMPPPGFPGMPPPPPLPLTGQAFPGVVPPQLPPTGAGGVPPPGVVVPPAPPLGGVLAPPVPGAPGSGIAAAAHAMAAVPDDLVPPNPTLVVQGLPRGVTQADIAQVFGEPRFDGLVEVRMVPGRDIAFVEYVNEEMSGRAKQALHETKAFAELGKDEVVKVTFRK